MINNNLHFFIIHCSEHTERLENIEVFKLNNPKLEIIKGYYTKNISLKLPEKLNYLKDVDINLNFKKNTFSKSGEIGCYLSHHMLIKKIVDEKLDGYSIIFEDDATINNNFYNDVNNIIIKLITLNYEWDIIFLGNLTRNRKDNIIDNIYTVDKNNCLTGTHALLINNKNVQKIYDCTCKIEHSIDWQYKINIDNGILNGLVVYPQISFQQLQKYKSNIQ